MGVEVFVKEAPLAIKIYLVNGTPAEMFRNKE